MEERVLSRAVGEQHDIKWFKLIFDLCNKVNVPPMKEDFEEAMKHEKFDKLSKECQVTIKESYKKYYSQ